MSKSARLTGAETGLTGNMQLDLPLQEGTEGVRQAPSELSWGHKVITFFRGRVLA